MLLLLAACGHVEPAPEDLDGLAHWMWEKYATSSDEELAVAVGNLDAAIGTLTEPRTGGLSDLTASEQGTVTLAEPQDPADATGMFVLDTLPCTLDQADRIAYDLDQDVLYEDVYDSYHREYTSDLDAYTTRQDPFLSWHSTIGATVLGNSYVEEVEGGLRWSEPVPAAPLGPFLLARAFLAEPAVFENDAASFRQDYQLELFYERDAGSVIHAWFLWREMDYGAGLDTNNEDIVALMLNKLEEWDEHTAAICDDGGP